MVTLNSVGLARNLALCLALPGTAIIVYLLWKQSKENELENTQNAIISRQSIVEVKIPADCVGSIIGSEGSIIKEIQKNTNTRMQFKRSEEADQQRTLVIRGTNLNVQRAELEIKRLISEKPITTTDTIEVPQELCGKIIGKNGANINLMRKITGCKISISKDPLRSLDNTLKSEVTIVGSIEQIQHAKELINEKVKEEEQRKLKRKNSRQSLSNNSIKSLQQQQQYSNSSVQETTLERFSNKKPRSMEFPFDDSELTVFVSAVADPNTFWVHIVDDDTIKLDRLVDSMLEYYEKNKNDKKFLVNEFRAGDLVAATFNGSGWYRGEIKRIVQRSEVKSDKNNNTFNSETNMEEDSELIDLYYVDFGDSAYVEKSSLRQLLTEFTELPCQAVQCALNDIEPNEIDEWNETAIDFFEDVTYSCQWKELKAKLVYFKDNRDTDKPMPLINLYDPAKNLDISEELITAGYAVRTTDKSNRVAHKF